MTVFYNEVEPYAVRWLKALLLDDHIAFGKVDARSIVELVSEDIVGFAQAHFFAGIGVWSHALKLAGWPDGVPVWTGSCPCQPFSQAGRRKGIEDERHLWPEWFRLIEACRPPVIFGEQVASKDGLAWFDAVSLDLERAGYTVGAFDLCAAGVGAPHIRQRLYFVALSDVQRCKGIGVRLRERRSLEAVSQARRSGETRELADAGRAGPQVGPWSEERRGAVREQRQALASNGVPRCMADAASGGLQEGQASEACSSRKDGPRSADRARLGDASGARGRGNTGAVLGAQEARDPKRLEARSVAHLPEFAGAARGFWSGADWLFCRDEKWRPVEPGAFPLAHGATGRVGKLRAYGNAIVAPLAQVFVKSVIDYLVELAS